MVDHLKIIIIMYRGLILLLTYTTLHDDVIMTLVMNMRYSEEFMLLLHTDKNDLFRMSGG